MMEYEKNEQTSNWKIDLSIIGNIWLFKKHIVKGFFKTTVEWRPVECFVTIEAAKKRYEILKNLPEYL